MSVQQPFGYYGGKQRLATRICALLPPHKVYVEPFAGGASVYWRKDRPAVTDNHEYREVLNDQRGELVNFFRVLQDPEQHRELEHRILNTPYSLAEYQRAREILADETSTPMLKAWAWWVSQVQSFAKKGANQGWGFGKQSENLPMQRFRCAEWIATSEPHRRLRQTSIESSDALKVIQRWDSPHTCFYVDPPYPGTDLGPYGAYTQADFDALITALSECRGSFVLSCYPNDGVPTNWQKREIATIMTASLKKDMDRTRTECLWVMDRSAGVGGYRWTESGWVLVRPNSTVALMPEYAQIEAWA